MRYGILNDQEVDKLLDDGRWFILSYTNTDNPRVKRWIHMDDAMVRFGISPVIRRYGDWAVTSYGVEHFCSHNALSYERIQNDPYIADYCLRKLGYWEETFDMAIECARRAVTTHTPVAAPQVDALRIRRSMTRKKRTGSASGVYVLECNGYYKIGYSTDVPSRVKAIQTNTPFDVYHLFTISSATPVQLERDLHQRFAAKRYRREWFALDAADIAVLRTLAT